MKITIWVMLIVGLVEVGANSLFFIHLARGKGFTIAKKFHGDFPSFATNKAWTNKIVASIILGVVALIAAFFVYMDIEIQMILATIFAGGMLLMCIIEAALYGKRHLPARLSVVIGVALVVLVILRV